MEERKVPWWRKALAFALGGIRSAFGLFPRPQADKEQIEAQSDTGQKQEPLQEIEEPVLRTNPEEDTALTDHFPEPEIIAVIEAEADGVSEAESETIAAAVAVTEAEQETEPQAAEINMPAVAIVEAAGDEQSAEASPLRNIEEAAVEPAQAEVEPAEEEAPLDPPCADVESQQAQTECPALEPEADDGGADPSPEAAESPACANESVDGATALDESASRGALIPAIPEPHMNLNRENPEDTAEATEQAQAEMPAPGDALEESAKTQEAVAEEAVATQAMGEELLDPATQEAEADDAAGPQLESSVPEEVKEAESAQETAVESVAVPEDEPAVELIAEAAEEAPAESQGDQASVSTAEVAEAGTQDGAAAAETAEVEKAAPVVETPAQAQEPTGPAPAKPFIKLEARGDGPDSSPFSVIVSQVYDGPLDLLLDLIRKQDIDIYDIPIARITAQFLAYVNQLKATDVDVAGEFIYTASLLIHIKSKMLLPRAPAGPDDQAEDPRRELVERLLEHERFKNAAQMLQQKQMLEAATWSNPGIREFRNDVEAEPEIAADTVDLVRVFRDILERARNRPVINVEEDSVTVGQMIQFLARRLNMEDKPVALRRLLSHTKSERALIAMFLALLELVRLQAILLRQDRAFSEIFIKKNSEFDVVMNEAMANARDDWR